MDIDPVGSDGARALLTFRTTLGEGEASFSFSGAMTLVLERGEEGWQIVGGHTSTPNPGR